MGASSRPPEFKLSDLNLQQCADFFINYFERWRAALNLSGFYMAGHSYGGYIVGLYARKYGRHIKKVLLLSPIGITFFTKEQLQQDYSIPANMHRNDNAYSAIRLKINCMVLKMFANFAFWLHLTPFSLGRMFGKSVAIKLIDDYIDRK